MTRRSEVSGLCPTRASAFQIIGMEKLLRGAARAAPFFNTREIRADSRKGTMRLQRLIDQREFLSLAVTRRITDYHFRSRNFIFSAHNLFVGPMNLHC